MLQFGFKMSSIGHVLKAWSLDWHWEGMELLRWGLIEGLRSLGVCPQRRLGDMSLLISQPPEGEQPFHCTFSTTMCYISPQAKKQHHQLTMGQNLQKL